MQDRPEQQVGDLRIARCKHPLQDIHPDVFRQRRPGGHGRIHELLSAGIRDDDVRLRKMPGHEMFGLGSEGGNIVPRQGFR
jgi:hypothetical protein